MKAPSLPSARRSVPRSHNRSRRDNHQLLRFTFRHPRLLITLVLTGAILAATPGELVTGAVTPSFATKQNFSTNATPIAVASSGMFAPGAYVIDMGQPTQTVANSLKPYGLVYDLVTNFKVPVNWAINPAKTTFRLDAGDPIPVDFTATIATGTKSYSGGSFIIDAAFLTPAVIADINTWKAQGVVVDTLAAPLTTLIYGQITSFPRAVLDAENGAVAVPYYTNAGVPASSYQIGNPTDLDHCDDVYILPHANPASWPVLWQQDLDNFVTVGGGLWASGNSVSEIEDLVINGSTQLNFLTNNGLVPFGSHSDGTLPYSYNPAAANDPEMQILNRLDAATQNGSEQIYVPTSLDWRSTTTVAVFDPDHPNNPPAGTSPFNKASGVAYGNAFGDPAKGLVMYEAGDSLAGTAAANIAAQRAFFNFLLTEGILKSPQPSVSFPTVVPGQNTTLTATISGGSGAYSYQWISSNGGVFSQPAGTWNVGDPPITTQYLMTGANDTVRLLITDTCGRQGIFSTNLAEATPTLDLDANDSSGASGADYKGYFSGGAIVPGADTDTLITDNGTVIHSAAIKLTTRPDGAAETLLINEALATGFGINVASDGNGGFVLTGTALLAQYQQVIASLQYTNSLSSPTPTTRAITVTVNDGISNSNTATSRLFFLGGSGTTVNKQLYLSDPGQGMDRVDPVATNDTTTSSVSVVPAAGAMPTTTTFTQTAAMTSAFVIPAGGAVKVTTYIQVTSGSLPALPKLNVQLGQGGSGFLTINTSPTVTALGNGIFKLEWTGTNPNDVTVPTGGQISLTLIDFDSSYVFNVLYDSKDFPSQLQLATATGIAVDTVGVFAAAYPGGSPLSIAPAGQQAFVRFTVSDPFGAADITSADVRIKNSSGVTVLSTTLTDGSVVAATAGSKTYEIAWFPPLGDTFTISVTAHEGTEGVTGIGQTTVIAVASPDLVVSKSDGGATVNPGSSVAYTINYSNAGLANATGVVLTEYLPAGSTFNTAGSTPGWSALGSGAFAYTVGNLALGASGSVVFSVTVPTPVPTGLEQLGNTVVISDDGTHGVDSNPANNTGVDPTPINAAPDLVITKTDGGTSTLAGGIVLYQIHYSNTGTQNADGVVITETLPANTTFNSTYSFGAWHDDGGGRFTLSIGDLAAGVSGTVTFAVNVASPLPGGVTQIVDTVSIADGADSGADLNLANNTATDTTPIAANSQTDLQITKSDSLTSVQPGGVVTDTITVTNAGPNPVTGAAFTDNVPASLTGVSYTTAVAGSATVTPASGAGNNISGLLNLPVGGTVTYTVTGTLDPNATGTLNNFATILPPAGMLDPNTGNNTAVDSHPIVPVADLTLSKTFTSTDLDGSGTLTPGDRIIFALTLTNSGPNPAYNVSVEDLLPNGYQYVSDDAAINGGTYSAGTGLWNVGRTLGATSPNNTAVLRITAVVGPRGTYTNVVQVHGSDSFDPDSTPDNDVPTEDDFASVTPTVQLQSDLSLDQTMALTSDLDGSGNLSVGDRVTFTLTLNNGGPNDAANVHVKDLLPAGYAFFSSSPSQGTYISGTGDWNVGTVNVLSTPTLSIVATVVGVKPAGAYTNAAQISASGSFDPDSTPNNNSTSEDDDTSVMPPIADLSLTKTVALAPGGDLDGTGTPSTGDQIVFTVTVANAGPDFATGVRVTDLLTSGFTYTGDNSAGTYDPGTGIWNVGVVAPGTTVTLNINATVNPTGSYVNTAQVTANEHFDPDSTPNNNVASEDDQATITVNCGPTVVTNSNDSGAGSLRDIILHACPGTTITFDMTAGHVTSPISLTSAALLIDKNLTIQGPGANALTVERDSGAATRFRIFTITSGTVAISGLTISKGFTADGIGIGNASGTEGGGISNSGTLTLTNVTVSGNQTGHGADDTGLGFGGAGGSGGGIFNLSGATLIIINSTLSANQTGQGGNSPSGGANGFGGSGGGITNSGTLTLTNSTISGNGTGFPGSGAGAPGSAGFGGGIWNGNGSLTISNTTITDNTAGAGGGINESGAGIITLKTSIVGGNSAPTGPDIFGPVNSEGYNLIQSTSEATITETLNAGTNITLQNPLLNPLADNAGPTKTHLLLPGSPAINAGDPAFGPPPDTDQRGFSRVVGGRIDIGAVEVNYAINASAGTPQSSPINTAFPTQLQATVTQSGNPISGVTVTFTAPSSGPSGSFSGNVTTADVVTNASGVATAPVFTTNGTTGSYNVVASIGNGLPTALFTLTNNKAATTTALSSSLNPSGLAQNVTFTADVSSTAGIPTGTVVFKDAGNPIACTNGGGQTLNGSGIATCQTSSLTVATHTITADYSGDANFLISSGTLSGGQLVNNRPLIKFSQSNYAVNENGRFVTITVDRSGDTSAAVNVDFATPDDSAAMTVLPCSTANGVASPRCDFTTELGTLKFAPGETSKTFDLLISQDTFVEGPETLTLTLSNLTGAAGFAQPSDANATVTITDDDLSGSSINAIDDTDTFVRQHYHDFLNREPDASGLAFWKDNIDKCNDPARLPVGLTVAQCIEVFRINTSAAFFLSIEFQNTGYFVERIYKAAFGDISPPTVPVPVRFTNFIPDTQEVGSGIIVGEGNWQTQLDNNKSAFALSFVQRSNFLNRYPALTSATAFVDLINMNAGNVLSDSERSALIAELSPNPADPALRADVLRKIADNALLQQRESNSAFVLMQYFVYLRRNPDATPEPNLNFDGFYFWLNKLNGFNGDFTKAEMVKAFLSSIEYRQRFGP